jgi:hypothetical protein
MTDYPTSEERTARVDTALALVARGLSMIDTIKYMREKTEWGAELHERTLRQYIYDARAQLAAMATGDIDRKEQYTLAVMRLNEAYRIARQMNDVRGQVSAVQASVSLMKLDTPSANVSWESKATDKYGIQDTRRVREMGHKMLTIVATSPDKAEQLFQLIDGLYAQLSA